MSLTTKCFGKPNIAGVYVHYVLNSGETVGTIHEIRQTGAYYVNPRAPCRLYADNRRYRSLDAALQSPEWYPLSAIAKADEASR